MGIYIKLVFTAIFWGGTFIAGRIIVNDVDPYSAAFLRFVVASFFLMLLAWKIDGKWPAIHKRQILPLFLLAMTGIFLYNVFFFSGLKIIEAGRAAIIIANNPICISLLAALIFKERLSGPKLIGIVLSVSGALVVISKGHPGQILSGSLGKGELYILGCVLSWSAFSLIGKAVLKGLSPVASITYASLLGSILLALPACRQGVLKNMWTYHLSDWLGIFYLGFFGTVLGFVWYYEGIQKLGPMKASIFINFVPISAILLAFIILKEPLTISLLAGTLLVIAGVYLTNTARI